jgi:hypothetical protein
MRRAGGSAESQEQWRALRLWMKNLRHDFASAAGELYPEQLRVEGTGLLARPEWLPTQPVELSRPEFSFRQDAAAPAVLGSGPESVSVRPFDEAGQRFATYAEAIEALDRPALFENRPLYRLLAVDLGDLGGAGRLDFTLGHYFDSVSIGEALAHEFAAAAAACGAGGPVSLDRLPLRAAIGDPCDLSRRPASVAVTTLTLRRSGPGQASFLLHWRDPARVTNAGGLYQVMPVGIFQPADLNPASVRPDLDLWHGLTREFSEELLGAPEEYADLGSPVEYERWPFFRRLTDARRSGGLRVWIVGVGVDPLTMVTDILTVAVFGAELFDEVFAGLVAVNSEGRVITDEGTIGFALGEDSVARFSGSEPMQAAGAAVLRLAWRFAEALIG